ncbi:MAG: peptide chain release factor N(5)-glutamine methyltransferase [Pyrinomonadaceae bacterium]
MISIESLLEAARDELEKNGIPSATREARSLLGFAIGKDAAFLIAHPEFNVSQDLAELFLDSVRRRARHEPFHYITGSRDFYGLEFEVSREVLIPRPETELLVERALEFLRTRPAQRFCEVGVGSGCITVSILFHAPNSEAVGLEVSEGALDIAGRNADRHGVGSRLVLRLSDVFQSLTADERFDLIVSNPPYVPTNDLEGLQPDVRLYEPHIALTAGADGLAIIRSIVEDAPNHLTPGGRLLLEIGFGQAEAVMGLFDPARWTSATLHPDLQGIPRVVEAITADI